MTKEFLQYGGDHYKKAGHLQHWDMIAAMGHSWEYYIDRSAAYLTRVKDTALDPKKAGHFVDKLLELIDTGELPATYSPRPTQFNTGPGFDEYMTRYFAANNISPDGWEARAIVALMRARSREDLVRARKVVTWFEQGRPVNPTPAQREAILDREAEGPTPEQTLNPTGTWPFGPPNVDIDTGGGFARNHLNVSGGGGDFGGGGATSSFGDDRVFIVGDSSADPMPTETCSRSDYSSGGGDSGGSSGGDSGGSSGGDVSS